MANRIRELRVARGLTLERVAELAGTSLQQVQRLESGKRRLTEGWMRRLAPVLGVAPADLMSDALPDGDQIGQHSENALVLRWWGLLTPDEKRMIVSFARDKGIEILTDKPKNRAG